MLQVKQPHTAVSLLGFLIAYLSIALFPRSAVAQGYDDAFEMKNKLKVELQYADYGEYEYPEPILFQYGKADYQQIQPYIVNFPEKRGLIKFVRLVGDATAVGVKYQYSDLKEDARQHFAEARVTRNLSETTIGLASVQLLRDTRGFSAYQGGLGALWDASVLTSLQGDVQYYYRGPEARDVGGKMGTWNFRLKARQVLTLSTAIQGEYVFYDATGDGVAFRSHSAGIWLSQYLPTETAIHLHLRYYSNTIGIRSLAPSLEIAQYIDWATVVSVKFRYYVNKSDNVSFGETGVIIPDGLRSRSLSAQVNREFSPSVLMYMKYRYYASTLNVQMNTYLLGAVYSF
jgi:hypothetical protein